MKTKTMVSVIALLLCLAATVGLRIALNAAEADYDEVKAMVVSSETKQKKVLGKRQTVYEVIVSYEGQRYELQNTHGTSSYRPGREVTVFLSNGELYANVEGVKTSTPLAKAYFLFLFATFGMVIVTVMVIGQAKRSPRTV